MRMASILPFPSLLAQAPKRQRIESYEWCLQRLQGGSFSLHDAWKIYHYDAAQVGALEAVQYTFKNSAPSSALLDTSAQILGCVLAGLAAYKMNELGPGVKRMLQDVFSHAADHFSQLLPREVARGPFVSAPSLSLLRSLAESSRLGHWSTDPSFLFFSAVLGYAEQQLSYLKTHPQSNKKCEGVLPFKPAHPLLFKTIKPSPVADEAQNDGRVDEDASPLQSRDGNELASFVTESNAIADSSGFVHFQEVFSRDIDSAHLPQWSPDELLTFASLPDLSINMDVDEQQDTTDQPMSPVHATHHTTAQRTHSLIKDSPLDAATHQVDLPCRSEPWELPAQKTLTPVSQALFELCYPQQSYARENVLSADQHLYLDASSDELRSVIHSYSKSLFDAVLLELEGHAYQRSLSATTSLSKAIGQAQDLFIFEWDSVLWSLHSFFKEQGQDERHIAAYGELILTALSRQILANPLSAHYQARTDQAEVLAHLAYRFCDIFGCKPASVWLFFALSQREPNASWLGPLARSWRLFFKTKPAWLLACFQAPLFQSAARSGMIHLASA